MTETSAAKSNAAAPLCSKDTLVRAIYFIAAVILGFVLVETPWSNGVLTMGWHYAWPNLVVLALGCGIVWLAGQRTRGALAVFVGLCVAAGTANFFIITFKGQPIVPADLFALSTAASVSGGYSLFLTPRLALCLMAFAAFCVALHWCPRRPIGRWDAVANCLGAALLVAAGAMQFNAVDIREEFDVTVDVWDVRGSYEAQGTTLCFLSRAQELTPKPPEGYSRDAVDALLAPYEQPPVGVPSDQNAATSSHAEETGRAYDGPNVIAIMNETFSDLSSYPGLEDAAAVTEYFHTVAGDALAAGNVYVSAMGGGTCNSEFEFLTGASMGNMGGGVYPYVLYDVDGVDNLASYFRDLGYGTHAIHPAEASNWRRDRIYEQFGFDTFDDITTMEDAETFRDLVTDKATYERVLQKIDESADPQFVFDVTIQNHGGYDTGLVPEADRVHVESDAVNSPEVDEFLAAIKRSDEDLHWLIDELNARDEPTVVVFFGDHQPGFADWLFEATCGKSVDDATLEEVQERYHTPYFIWANEAARVQYGDRLHAIEDADVTSVNYLRDLLVEATGLPETATDRYRLALRQVMPAVNLNGYMDAEGVWHWFDEEIEAAARAADGQDEESEAQAAAKEALSGFALIQYDQLFGKHADAEVR